MGNRAVINFVETPEIGVYLHWNGGRDSIEAFLKYCELKKCRDDNYGVARFIQVISNFFNGNLSIGVDVLKNLDCHNWDNGMYIVKDWKIVERKYIPSDFKEQKEFDLKTMLMVIDANQPIESRLFELEPKLLENL